MASDPGASSSTSSPGVSVQYDSSSDEDDMDGNSIIDKVTQSYPRNSENDDYIRRTVYYLEMNLQTGAVSCLICLSSIKRADAIWSCGQCYTMFHIHCIHKWAKDSITTKEQAAAENPEGMVVVRPRKIEWNCPQCRLGYHKNTIPKHYICFCGGVFDPPAQSWLLPHSCGEFCSKKLDPDCGHRCKLLCHPGACPPCPRMKTTKCHCGRQPATSIRCKQMGWSCGEPCNKPRDCEHPCPAECHGGDCPPCEETVNLECLCGRNTKQGACSSEDWMCEQVCDELLPCGNHRCEDTCHAPGDCMPCPLEGLTSCPCGAEKMRVVCPYPAPLCGGTCGKIMECGHQCHMLCHRGDCPTCHQVVQKECPCGAVSRTVPCDRFFRCQTRCRRATCPRHVCGRRCCPRCPPCEKTCGKQLSCGRHKCNMACHPGPCYPCGIQSISSCFCGETVVKVNCGTKKVRPPICLRNCKIRYRCEHTEHPLNRHRCHRGECPPCAVNCNATLECGHTCPAICHKDIKIIFKRTITPLTPVDIQRPRVERMELECPPCTVPVEFPCLGGHTVTTRPCYDDKIISCGEICGKPLPCTNHTCQKICHSEEEGCGACAEKCTAARACPHPCARARCHAGACPPCALTVRAPCPCGVQSVLAECAELAGADLSCGGRCHRTMSCGHRCIYNCHLGECSSPSECEKKLKVCCPCGTVKKELLCALAKGTEVNCEKECEEKRLAAEKAAQLAQEKELQMEAEKNKRELEKFERLFRRGRSRNKKEKVKVAEKGNGNRNLYIAAAIVLVVAVCIAFYMYFE